MPRDLVERAMGGDRDAFAELQHRSIDQLYATARLILGDGDLAQDATQEAFIAAWRGLRGLRDPDRFEAWLRRLIISACYREARKARRRTRAEGQVRPIDPGSSDPARATVDRPDATQLVRIDGEDLEVFHRDTGDVTVIGTVETTPGLTGPFLYDEAEPSWQRVAE